MKKNKLLLVLIVPLFFACEEKDGCDDCQAAIQHMAEKISNYSCNPYFMQNAWDKIVSDCGAMGDTYVGYMAETCSQGKLIIPTCDGSLMANGVKIAFYSTSGIPEDLDITIQYPRHNGSENLRFKGIYLETKLSDMIGEDDEITLSIYSVSGLNPIHTETFKFSFARNGNWSLIRGVQINYDESEKVYSFAFDDWDNQV